MRSDIYRPAAYGAGETVRQRIRITQYPQNITPQLHNPPKMCGGLQKGANPSSFGYRVIVYRLVNTIARRSAGAGDFWRKVKKMDDHYDRYNGMEELLGTNLAEVGTDCISKQSAIDAVYKCSDIFVGDMPVMVVKADEYEALAQLPPAQPEIIRCKDCKFWTHIKRTNRYWCKTDDGLYDLNPSPNDFCSRAERRTNG